MKKGSNSYAIFKTMLAFGFENVQLVKHKMNRGHYAVIDGKDYFLGYKSGAIRKKLMSGLLDHLKK